MAKISDASDPDPRPMGLFERIISAAYLSTNRASEGPRYPIFGALLCV